MNFQEMKEVATLFAASKLFPDAPAMAQAFVKIQAGAELGFGPYQSMTAFDIIKGKVALNANGQAVKLKSSGRYDYQILEHTNQACEIEFFEIKDSEHIVDGRFIRKHDRRSLGKSRFTLDDAKQAGLTGSDMYRKYPRNMLFSRAMTNGVGWYCPDAIGIRVYGDGELTDDAAGQVSEPQSPALSGDSPAPALPAPAFKDVLGAKLAEARGKPQMAVVKTHDEDGLAVHPEDREESPPETLEDAVDAEKVDLARQAVAQLARILPPLKSPTEEQKKTRHDGMKQLLKLAFGLDLKYASMSEVELRKLPLSHLLDGLEALKQQEVRS